MIEPKLGEIIASLAYQTRKIEELCKSVEAQNGRVRKLEISEWWWKGVLATVALGLTISGFFLRDDVSYIFHALPNHTAVVEELKQDDEKITRLKNGENQLVLELHKEHPGFILEDFPGAEGQRVEKEKRE